jgi:hypothetical protein
LTDLTVYDNSADAPPLLGQQPVPNLLLHTADGVILEVVSLDSVPEWAKPIVMATLRSHERSDRRDQH